MSSISPDEDKKRKIVKEYLDKKIDNAELKRRLDELTPSTTAQAATKITQVNAPEVDFTQAKEILRSLKEKSEKVKKL